MKNDAKHKEQEDDDDEDDYGDCGEGVAEDGGEGERHFQLVLRFEIEGSERREDFDLVKQILGNLMRLIGWLDIKGVGFYA